MQSPELLSVRLNPQYVNYCNIWLVSVNCSGAIYLWYVWQYHITMSVILAYSTSDKQRQTIQLVTPRPLITPP